MYYIGVDLGGTTIKVGLLDSDYTIIEKIDAPTYRERTSEEVLKDMAMLCKKVMENKGITEKEVHSIGIGCPGIASPKEGKILYSSNLNFKDVDVKSEIRKYIDLDVFVENDANAAALGEVICGAAKGYNNVVVVTLGTGVGGGIILDGKVYPGSYFGGAEIGHQVIQFEGGIPCGCGRSGCWEQYASATALIRQGKEAAGAHPESLLIQMAKDKDIEEINAKVVFDAAQAGDEVAINVLEQYYKYVGAGISNMINILEPEVVVIGGGMSAQKEKLTEPILAYCKTQMYGGLDLRPQIKPATLGNDAGIIGAALVGTRL